MSVFLGLINLLPALVKFFDYVKWFVELLKGTPEEQHDALIKKIQAEADIMKKTGRPVW